MINEAKRRFDAFIRAEGLKETAQRALILETFMSSQKHMSVDDLYSVIQKKKRRVGYATVSRTMKLIAGCGLAREVMFNDGVVRFEHTVDREHHHHLVCTRCHKVIEFSNPKMDRGEEEILRQHGFSAEFHRYEIFGLCRDCQKATNNRKTSRR